MPRGRVDDLDDAMRLLVWVAAAGFLLAGWALLTGCGNTPLCPPCAQCPQLGRYQLQRDTGRTWRLDTATGDICLMLAPETDWKKPDIKAMGCY